ncbi:MAG: ATP-binding protein [Burkholderiales bacterium]
MSLQKRLLLFLLIGTPLVWLLALGFAYWRAVDEINELFDTEQVRLAQQIRATLPDVPVQAAGSSSTTTATLKDKGGAEPEDLLIAVWDEAGHLTWSDREGVQLPRTSGLTGFREVLLGQAGGQEAWRVYYDTAQQGRWQIAVGQRLGERDELVLDLMASQLGPWLILLPVLLVIMLAGVRRALAPVRQLSEGLARRSADDLGAVQGPVPQELSPLVTALNQLFQRVQQAMQHERQLTADAAHELRTPLAALRAHLEVAQLAQQEPARQQALKQTTQALDRLNHLLNQLLLSARVDNWSRISTAQQAVNWPQVVEQVLSDCMPQITRRQADIECHWPAQGQTPFPVQGDDTWCSLLLRNLVDNALRYGPPGVKITLRFEPTRMVVEDTGPGVTDEELKRLGDRFYRPVGQQEPGSGLGLSIVKRIAESHGLKVRFEACQPHGLRVLISSA